jgi:hypothetical protein
MLVAVLPTTQTAAARTQERISAQMDHHNGGGGGMDHGSGGGMDMVPGW